MKNCKRTCSDCIYYYAETEFCLNRMYSVIGTVENCADKRSIYEYPLSTPISELDFANELYDSRSEETTVAQLFEELDSIEQEEVI